MSEVDTLNEILKELSGEKAEPLSGISGATSSDNVIQNAEDISIEETPLHNRKRGGVVLQQEQLHHRIFALLKAQGHDCREIAELTGYTATTVQYTLAQPWMEALILKEVMRIGRTKIAAVLDAEVLPSVKKLIDVRDSEKASPDVQRKAANDLLDRVFGKPNQPISRTEDTAKDARLMSDAEIAEEIQKLKQRGSN